MFEKNIIKRNQISSTNTVAIELLKKEELPEGTIIWADEQTKGRGQRGTSWESEPGKNLTISIILFPHFLKVEDQFLLSKVTSLAIADYLSNQFNQVTIKWPNDIYVANDKIAGILIENSIIGSAFEYAVIGIGLNINQMKFVSNAPNPTSMQLLTGIEFNLEEVLGGLCSTLNKRYNQLIDYKVDDLNQEYLSSLFRFDEFYLYQQGQEIFSAKITGIDPFGALILQTKNGEMRKFGFREVEYVL